MLEKHKRKITELALIQRFFLIKKLVYIKSGNQ